MFKFLDPQPLLDETRATNLYDDISHRDSQKKETTKQKKWPLLHSQRSFCSREKSLYANI